MDFSFDEVQEDVRGLAAGLVEARVTPSRLRELEAGLERMDRDLWAELASANLLGLCLPERDGGSGYGIMEAVVVLEELGRAVAPVPFLETVVLGAMTVADHGSDEQRARLLPRVVDGSSVLTAALQEAAADPLAPATTARRDGDGWRLDGEKVAVPWGPLADVVLVPATTGPGTVGLFLVEPDAAGLTAERTESTHRQPQLNLTLDGVAVDAGGVLGDPEAGDEALRSVHRRALAGLCALGVGVFTQAVRITADYISEREQFGKPIATFQGATLTAADAYIETAGLTLAARAAAWRLAEGRPADDQLAIAKFWVADAGQRIAHRCQHLHGGMGVDIDYPIHRYFLWAKELELTLGGSTAQLLRLGASMAEEGDVYIDLNDSQRALRDELRAYFGQLMSSERRALVDEGHAGGDAYREVVRQLGRDGWLGVGWPKEHGGQGRGPIEQLIFLEEASRASVPIPMVTLNTVGPTIAQFGTDAQKERFLPPILRGELHFAIGYTEPGAGTDLASLRTRAVLDGDEYVVNGQKVFTTGGHDADFIWLACRTDADAPKHKGISILCVDTSLAGFKWTPIWTVGGGHTNATYYEDVRVPADMLVGEANGGWKMITTQLNFERVSLGPSAGIFRNLDQVTSWAATTTAADGGRVLDAEWVRINLARVRAKAEVAELFNWQVAAVQETGRLNPADASAMKVYGTELRIEALRLLMEIIGPAATLKKGSPGAALGGALEGEYRSAIVGTFGGGVNEIQREIVAAAGLRTPRVPR